MARTDPLVVSDAGPLIHLDELGCLDLLKDLGTILIPQEVWAEVAGHRPNLSLGDLPDVSIVDRAAEPSARLLSLIVSLGLDAGERAALALMESAAATLFLCDDAAARLTAESLGFTARGTIGIIVRSIRTKVRTRREVSALLRRIPHASSLHLSRQLLDKVIADVERVSNDS